MIEITHEGSIAIVRMAHGRANVLDVDLLRGLEARFAELEASDARAVVLTGTGSIFSAGVDLLKVRDGGVAYLEEFLPLLDAALQRVFELPIPVVAAANGHAIAGGAVLLCACDERLLAEGHGRVGVPELRVGLPFPPFGLEILRAALSPGTLARLVYSGDTLAGPEALACGLVDEIVPAEALAERALERARTLSTIPRESFALTKEQLRAPARMFCEGPGAETTAAVRAQWASEPAQRAIRAYLERTLKK